MAVTLEQAHQRYLDAALSLLPQGLLSRRKDSWIGKMLSGLNWENARFFLRLQQWKLECVPGTAEETLSDWEAFTKIPDGCIPIGDTVEKRQNNLGLRFNQTGSQSEPTYKAMAASLGYDITITKREPFRCGISRVGDALYEDTEKFTRIINTPSGDDDTLLQCVLNGHAQIFGNLEFNFL